MSDIQIVAVAAATTTCIVAATRACLAVRLAAIRAQVAQTTENAQAYAMLERTAQRPKKPTKTAPPVPYGL